MKLIPFFVVAICIVATCGGEDEVKNGKIQASSQDMGKQLAALKEENEELKKEIILQRVELDQLRQIKIQIQVQANATGDTRKLCLSEIEKYLQERNNSDGQGKNTDSGIQTDHSSEARRLIALNGKAKWDGDVVDGQHGTVENAFSNNNNYGCAGWSKSASDYTQPWPVMVWYEFESTYTPARFSFRVYNSKSALATPKTWRFVGSQESGCSHDSTWKQLCGVMAGDKIKKPDMGEEVGCDVPKSLREPFKCMGISVYYNYFDSHAVCLTDMKFWENDPSV